MKTAIGIQVAVLAVLLSYWTALFFGVQVPPANQAEVTAGKDVLLVLLNLASLSNMIQAVNNKLSKGDPDVKADSAAAGP